MPFHGNNNLRTSPFSTSTFFTTMLPRFLLSGRGATTLQLQRLLVTTPSRTTVFRGAAVLGGHNAIGRLSPGMVRYGSSDSKDSEGGKPKKTTLKSKKLKKQDPNSEKFDKEKYEKYKAKKDDKYKKKDKKGKKDRDGEGEEELTSEVNGEPEIVVSGDGKEGALGRGGVVGGATVTAASGVSAPEVDASQSESTGEAAKNSIAAGASEPAPEAVVLPREAVPPAPTVAGSTPGPIPSNATDVIPQESAPPAGTTVPGVEGLEAAALESKTEETTTAPAAAQSEPVESRESTLKQKSRAKPKAKPEVVQVAPEDEIELSPRSEEIAETAGPAQQHTGPPDFYKLIASASISYANPHHLGRPQQPAAPSAQPQGASPPPTSPPPASSASPMIDQKHTSHSTPTAFPTTTTAPKPQAITFASSRLNTPVTTSGPEGSGKLAKAKKGVVTVKVPPKPEEPDNCCMSGCVNCVWDLYREELEDYAAQKLLAQQPTPPSPSILSHPSPISGAATSMDDDGGAAVSVPVDESEWLDNEDIPVGIRAFMATEKRLRERQRVRESEKRV